MKLVRFLMVLIVICGVVLRLLVFDKAGGDYLTYKKAMNSFRAGINPYVETVTSFKLTGVEHGYAYLPTLLYTQYTVWLLGNFIGSPVSTIFTWKIPVLLADFAFLYFIIKKFRSTQTLAEAILQLTVVAFWTFNPYLIARYDYSLYDPLFLFLILLALERVETKPIASGIFYALAVSLKTIPLILFPLFLIKSPNKVKFVLACIFVFVLISIPFMRSSYDFSTYIQGALLVHGEREVQGRPFLSIISFYLQDYGVNFMQQNFVNGYAFLALFASLALPPLLYFTKKLKDKYSWVTLSFFVYLLLTPVLNRTHLLWILPWLLIVIYVNAVSVKKQIFATCLLIVLWLFSFFYLFTWGNGLKVKTKENNMVLVLESSDDEWEFSRVLRQKYYEFRGKLL